MKRRLLFLMMILGGFTAQANTTADPIKRRATVHPVMTQPVMFIEDGIKFFIYPDGAIEFATPLNGSYAYNTGHRGSRSAEYGRNRSYFNNYVIRDRAGRVYKVGRVNLFYDRTGKVTRVGDTRIGYKHGELDQVGRMKIHYNRNGQFITYTNKDFKLDRNDVRIGDRSRRYD